MAVSKDNKRILLADLLEMQTKEPEKLIKLAQGYNRLEEAARTAQDAYKESHQANGKVIHVLKSAWLTAREQPGSKLLTSSSYPEHHENVTGGKPTRRGYQCAVTFGLLVVAAKMITEDDYDYCPCELVTLASEIIGKANNNADHEAVKEAAAILHLRPKTGIKDLKAIKARFVERTEGEGDDEKTVTVFVSKEEAAQLQKQANVLNSQSALGDMLTANQLPAIAAAILAHARSTENAEDIRAMVHMGCQLKPAIMENVDKEKNRRFSDETLAQFVAEVIPPVKKDVNYYKAEYQKAIAAQREIEDLFSQVDGGSNQLEAWSNEMTPVEAPTAEAAAAHEKAVENHPEIKA